MSENEVKAELNETDHTPKSDTLDNTKNEDRELDFPVWSLDKKMFQVIDTIDSFGGSASRNDIISKTGIPAGTMGSLVSSTKRYGFIDRLKGTNELTLTELGIEYCQKRGKPELQDVLIKAVLNVKYFDRILKEKQFSAALSLSVLKQIFTKYGAPDDYAGRLSNVFRDDLEILKLDFMELKGIAEAMRDQSPKGVAQEIEQSNTTQNNSSYDIKESFMVGYLVGLTTEKPQTHKLLNMLENNNIQQMHAHVQVINEQLKDGLIKEDVVVKYLGKKFAEFAKKQGLLTELEDKGESANRETATDKKG